jgi:carbon monoxide dehydrogenase subunit G
MATVRKEIEIGVPVEEAWDAVRDVGALHTRLVPGFVTAVRLEDGARVVTFGNGLVARELIVTVDDDARRLVWAVVGGRMTHHNASAQVFAEGAGRTRFVWTADLLPDEVAPAIEGMMDQAMPIIRATLERAAPRPGHPAEVQDSP